MNDQRRSEKVQRSFSEPEILAFQAELVRKTREQLEVGDAKAEATARFNADLKRLGEEIRQLSHLFELGFEWVEVEVIILLDQPAVGLKTLVRTDTGEEVRSEPMTPEDRQRAFGFEEPKEP
jgi:hypothetical protein